MVWDTNFCVLCLPLLQPWAQVAELSSGTVTTQQKQHSGTPEWFLICSMAGLEQQLGSYLTSPPVSSVHLPECQNTWIPIHLPACCPTVVQQSQVLGSACSRLVMINLVWDKTVPETRSCWVFFFFNNIPIVTCALQKCKWGKSSLGEVFIKWRSI